jgi:DNA-binding beta-propeller fold protein YncE
MKIFHVGCALLLAALGASTAPAQPASSLRLVARIPLENVEGRIDHFGIDVKGERLFMSALGNDTVEVFDLRSNRRLHSISGLREPQGTTYAPDSNRIFVANGGDGAVRVFDGTSYKLLETIRFSSDADDTRYDAATQQVYVGYGEGAVAAMDSTTGKALGEIKVSGHPEAYEVERGGGRIFINVPDAHNIEVGDWQRKRVVARWPTGVYSANFPMAIDPEEHRLFVVARLPAQLLVFDSDSGKIVAHLPVVSDSDDLWYDAKNRRIYISGGQGFVTVVAQRDADHYRAIEKIPTGSGARTSFFSADLDRLYVAVPHRGSQRGELLVFAPAP